MDSETEQKNSPDLIRNIRKHYFQLLFFLIIAAVILFVSAGTLAWVWSWAYIAVYVLFNAAMLFILPRELLAERGKPQKNVKKWDKVLMGIGIPFGFTTFLIAGMDKRFQWTPAVSVNMHIVCLALFVLGNVIIGWSMASNRFFSMGVRIQDERGHKVAEGGPYKYIRHPGYAGIIINAVSTPLLLGSLWAFIPAILSAAIFVVRIVFEDRTLQNELDGYKEYTEKVRYRLMPGIW